MKIKRFIGTDMESGFSVTAEQDLPLAYITDDQQVPEDLHQARAYDLANRMAAIMQDVGVGAKDHPVSTMNARMAAHVHG